MPQTQFYDRTLTQLDHARLSRLVSRANAAGAVEVMHDMLDCSDVVPSPAVPPTVVTMNSQVVLKDEQDGSEFTIALRYPPEADAAAGQVSVLSPLGAAVLGMSVGEVATWQGPDGSERRARIQSILFQPEASGDYLL